MTRALYGFSAAEFTRVVENPIGLPNVVVEDWAAVAEAVALHARGLDFADALHLVRSRGCDAFVTFDDRRFARRAQRLGVEPPVRVPADPNA